jgi:hypothetical protein
LDHLEHSHKVDVIPVDHFSHKFDKLFFESLVGLEPGGVEVESNGCSVGVEMTVEIVPQQSSKLICLSDI